MLAHGCMHDVCAPLSFTYGFNTTCMLGEIKGGFWSKVCGSEGAITSIPRYPEIQYQM